MLQVQACSSDFIQIPFLSTMNSNTISKNGVNKEVYTLKSQFISNNIRNKHL